MMNFCKGASNPQAALQTLMGQNPQMKQVMDLVRQGGGDPKTVFYKLKHRIKHRQHIFNCVNQTITPF